MEPFTCTSKEPYNQCFYALIMEDDSCHKFYSNYEDLRNYWMMHGGQIQDKKMKTVVCVTCDEWTAASKKPQPKRGF